MGLRTYSLDQGWDFHRLGESIEPRRVDLPHGAFVTNVDGGGHWFGECSYQREVSWPEPRDGERCVLHVDAAMHTATVLVNGAAIARHIGGYLPFEVDLTAQLKDGAGHRLEIRVDNRPTPHVPPGKPFEELDFCWYGGLYRGVELRVYPPVHITDAVAAGKIAGGGVFVRTLSATPEKAEVNVSVHVSSCYVTPTEGQVEIRLLQAQQLIAHASQAFVVNGRDSLQVSVQLSVSNPVLWSPDHPALHDLEVTVRNADGEVLDARSLRCGLRRIGFSRAKGFTVNGRRYRLRGTNRHQEHPCVGYAVPAAAERRDALRIKAAGFDYVRLSHYPQATAFLDACDELGIVVMNAIPGWQFIGGESFRRECRQAARDLIRRDRNHPCVVLWELSLNETAMDQEFMEQMHALGHQDYPGDQMFTCGWIDRFDVFIHSRQHGQLHTWSNGDKALVVSEYGDWEFYASNEGFDQKSGAGVLAPWASSRQFRGAGERALLQQAWNHVFAANDCLSSSAVLDGQWAMFDYARGYAPVRAAVGLMDAFRVSKFSFEFYRSQRGPAEPGVPGRSGPVVFVASYWTPDSDRRVTVFSNCEHVELVLNGRTCGRQSATPAWMSQYLPHPPIVFEIPRFEDGVLQARGIIGGVVVCEHAVRTPGPAQSVRLHFDLQGIGSPAAEADLIFVHAELVDSHGTRCVDQSGELQFGVEDGELIGASQVGLEAGVASALVRVSAGTPRTIVTVRHPALHFEASETLSRPMRPASATS